MVAILLRRRQLRHLDLPLLGLLLHPPPAHHRLRVHSALLRLQPVGLFRVRSAHGDDRLFDGVRVRQTYIWRHQGGLIVELWIWIVWASGRTIDITSGFQEADVIVASLGKWRWSGFFCHVL